MREFNLLNDYPKPDKPRFVSSKLRSIENRISASYRDKNLYDWDRNNGYGGYKYDGRWVKVAKNICTEKEWVRFLQSDTVTDSCLLFRISDNSN